MYCYYIILTISLVFISCTNDHAKQERKQVREHQYRYRKGRQLFREHCKTCHHENVIYIVLGPALGYSLDRRDSTWFRYHIKSGSYAAADDKDSLSLVLRAEGWNFMPGFDFLEEEEIDAIILYIKEAFKENRTKKSDDRARRQTDWKG